MAYIYLDASIECLEAKIISRDIVPSSLQDVPNVGVCKIYNCKRNTEAHIEKELAPKAPRRKTDSHLDLGDEIRGEDMVLFINAIKRICPEVINHTGRHKAQKATTNCYTFAQIIKMFPNIQIIKDPKQIAPPHAQLFSGK